MSHKLRFTSYNAYVADTQIIFTIYNLQNTIFFKNKYIENWFKNTVYCK